MRGGDGDDASDAAGLDRSRPWDRCDLALVGVLIAAVCAVGWRVRECHADDAMIVLRYAHHLLCGEGWVYNPGEAVNATTSPLHVMLTALLGALCGDLQLALPLAFALPLAACVVTVYRVTRPYGRRAAWFAGLLAAFAPRLHTTIGMETSLVLATTLGACVASARGRHALAGALCGFAVLARPDAALLAVLLAWCAGRTGRSAVLRFAVAAAAVAGPWFAYATVTFGSPVPSTLAIKLAQRDLFGGGPIFLRGAWGELRLLGGAWGVLGVAVAASLFAVAGVVLCLRARRHRAVALFVVFASLQFGCYAFADMPPYHWYYGPAFFALALVAGCAVAEVLAKGRAAEQAGAVVSAALLVIVAMPELARPESTRDHYRVLGLWLREHTRSDASVALGDIGIAGYHALPRRIVDMQGLVTPGGADAIAAGDTGWWFDRYRPDFVVFHEPIWATFEAPVAARAEFRQQYRRLPVRLPGFAVHQRVTPHAAAPR